MFNCTVATGLLIHSGYYLSFSILGFMALLREIKEDGVYSEAYIGITVTGCICAIYVLSQLQSIVDWFNHKILLP
jgi:hypothetical protein